MDGALNVNNFFTRPRLQSRSIGVVGRMYSAGHNSIGKPLRGQCTQDHVVQPTNTSTQTKSAAAGRSTLIFGLLVRTTGQLIVCPNRLKLI